MTLKGITRACYGSVFNGEEETRKMSHIYQKVIIKQNFLAIIYKSIAMWIISFIANHLQIFRM